MIQAPLPLGWCGACVFRGRSNGYPRKSGSSRQTSANLLEHPAGEPPEYLVMSEPRDFAESLNRFRGGVSGGPVRFHDHPRSEEEK